MLSALMSDRPDSSSSYPDIFKTGWPVKRGFLIPFFIMAYQLLNLSNESLRLNRQCHLLIKNQEITRPKTARGINTELPQKVTYQKPRSIHILKMTFIYTSY